MERALLEPQSVPSEWPRLPLRELADLRNGSAFSAQEWSQSGLPIVRIQNLKDRDAPFNYFRGDPASHVSLKKGDLVFSWSGSRGTSFGPHFWWGDAAVLNQHIFRVDLKNGVQVTRDFLYFALLHLTAEIETHAYGLGSLVHVRKGDFEATRIPLPPINEQLAVTNVLRLVQRAVEQQQRLAGLTVELKKALLEQLCTRGLRKEPQKATAIGRIPESWDLVPLGSLLREPLRNGHSARATNNGTGLRTLTLTAVTKRDFTLANTKLTSADPARVRDIWLHSGDILVERANTPEYVGLAALYEGPNDYAIYPDLMIRVRIDNNRVLPHFIAEYLITDHCRAYFQLNARSTAGNFPKIAQGTIENILVPLPTLDEQLEISDALRALIARGDFHTRKGTTLTEFFRTLLHQLMTAQIRPQDLDPADLDTAKSG